MLVAIDNKNRYVTKKQNKKNNTENWRLIQSLNLN
jgi:hypothetical protein